MKKIAAIIVTFNRKDLLLRCIRHVFAQTSPVDKIYVIDNASNDGSENYIFEALGVSKIIEYIVLPNNIGGAGGFNYGVQQAFNAGYDYLWLMDDDGFASSKCLQLMLPYLEEYDVVGPFVLAEANNDASAFPYTFNNAMSTDVQKLTSLETLPQVHPFNGIIIKKDMIKSVGFPNADFFIWGDEEDYQWRWRRAGFKEITIVRAIYFHPADRQVTKKIINGALPVINTSSIDRKYIYYRNRFYNIVRYHGTFHKRLLKIILSILVVLIFEKKKDIAMRALFNGLIGNLGIVRPKT